MTADTSWVDDMPEIYDRCLVPALFGPFALDVALRAARLAPRRVLELAAGTGVATAALVSALPDAGIVASDLNPAMVGWAADHVAGPEWVTADAQDLPFPDDSFDLVVCQFGVMFLPDKVAAFAEIARVLAPGGTLLFSVWDDVATSPFPSALVDSLAVVLPHDPPSFVVRIPHGYADADRIRADLAAGGLTVADLDQVVIEGRAPSARSLAEGFCFGTPLRFALQQRGLLPALCDAVADEMTARLGPGEVAAVNTALVVTARPATTGRPAG